MGNSNSWPSSGAVITLEGCCEPVTAKLDWVFVDECGAAITSKALVGALDEYEGIFEVSGTIDIYFEDETIFSELERTASQLADAADKFCKALHTDIYAEKKRQSHPRFQPNIKGFRK